VKAAILQAASRAGDAKPALRIVDVRGGSVCLYSLAGSLSGSPAG